MHSFSLLLSCPFLYYYIPNIKRAKEVVPVSTPLFLITVFGKLRFKLNLTFQDVLYSSKMCTNLVTFVYLFIYLLCMYCTM